MIGFSFNLVYAGQTPSALARLSENGHICPFPFP